MNQAVKILLVEDSEDDAMLVLRTLRHGGFEPAHRRVQTAAELESALAGERWDAVISDFNMPGFTGIDALRIFRSSDLDIPFILVSGAIGEETAVEAMKAGASDYVMKQSLARLAPALERELKETQIRAAHRQTRLDLIESEDRFRSLTEMSSDFYWESDAEHRLTQRASADRKLSTVSVFRQGAQIGERRWQIPYLSPDEAGWRAHRAALDAHRPFRDFELSRLGADATERYISISGDPVFDASGAFKGYRGVGKDITDRKAGERRVRDSEKRFKAIFDQAPIAMTLLDRQGRPIVANPPLSEMVGYSNDELSKMKFSDFTYPEDVDKDLHQFTALMEGRIPAYSMEKRYVHKNGNLIWAKLFVTMLRDENGLPQDIIGMAEDITERKRAEETRHHHAAELEESQRIARIGSWEWTPATGVIAWSDGMNHVLARDRALPAPTFEALAQFYTPESWQRLSAAIAGILDTGAPYDLELEMIRGDGATCWTTTRGEAVRAADGTFMKLRGTVHDITDRKKAEARIASLNRVYAMLSGVNALIVRVRERDELFREACRIAVAAGGFRLAWVALVERGAMRLKLVAWEGAAQEYLERIPLGLKQADSATFGLAGRAVCENKPIIVEDMEHDPRISLRNEARERNFHSLVMLPLVVSDTVVGVLALYASEIGFFNESEMKLLLDLAADISFALLHIKKEEEINYIAYYDVLTGLANRALFHERLAQSLVNAKEQGRNLALVLVDIERFRTINDTLGRQAGDALLKDVAARMSEKTVDAGRLGRLDADHFAVMVLKEQTGEELARLTEQRFAEIFSSPFRIGASELRVSARFGIAMFPGDGADADTLFRNAEAALKNAKTSGERYLFYTQSMNDRVAEKLSLESRLRKALEQGEFVLHFQPKVNLASGKVTGAEALIRWNDPRTGLVPPARFIPLLEETGLIHEVGRWALRQAIEDYLRWRNAGLPAPRIAVNVSPLQLRHRGFIEEIRQVIDIDAHAAAGLELELTEGMIMADVTHSIASLQAIRAMGITVAIDDFGTGFSSLSYLARLPVDTLKIDRSFVIDMTAGPQGLALVSTIISLAHSLKLKVVAEGVETEEQSHLLRLLSCDEMQGFLFGKPVPGEIYEAQFMARPPAG